MEPEKNRPKLSIRKIPHQPSTGPRTFNAEQSTVTAIAATEAPAMVFDRDRWDIVPEILRMDGVILPESGQVPLLDSHSRFSVGDVLGSATGFQIGTIGGHKALVCQVTYSGTTEGQSAAQKTREGHLTDYSVGYTIAEKTWVPSGQKQVIGGQIYEGPVSVVTRWKLKELSATPVGADEHAKARSEENFETTKKTRIKSMNFQMRTFLTGRGMPQNATDAEAWAFLSTMKIDEQRAAFDFASKTPSDSAISDAVKAERERAAIIRANCRAAELDEAFAEDLIERGATLEEAGRAVIEKTAERRRPLGVRLDDDGYGGTRKFSHGQDFSDKLRDAMTDGLCLRAGVRLEKPANGAREYRGLSLVDIGKELLSASGVNVRGASRRQVADAIFGGGGGFFGLFGSRSGSHSTSDFSALLAGVANKILRATYEQSASTWQKWTRTGDAADYKEMSRNQISEAPELLLITEYGEYREGSFTDAREVFRIQKYGRTFGLSREAFLNDDLGAFETIPKAFGLAASRKINESVYGVLMLNAKMADGKTLFHADHANLAAAGAVGSPDIETLSAARTAMRRQTGLNGVLLNVSPRFLIVPASLETAGDILLNSAGSTEENKNSGVKNPFHGKLELVVDPILDSDSTTTWYLTADPAQIDTVEVAFLDGEARPYVEDRIRFENDRLEWKVRLEFGTKAIDWRGLYKNPGA